mmetsp:Transcript_74000/g.173738  ORF Transcript_74000/g.173738 Transcript_74000/m.173738 type:complete len:249 (-) Transcript_74000:50-796(-)
MATQPVSLFTALSVCPGTNSSLLGTLLAGPSPPRSPETIRPSPSAIRAHSVVSLTLSGPSPPTISALSQPPPADGCFVARRHGSQPCSVGNTAPSLHGRRCKASSGWNTVPPMLLSVPKPLWLLRCEGGKDVSANSQPWMPPPPPELSPKGETRPTFSRSSPSGDSTTITGRTPRMSSVPTCSWWRGHSICHCRTMRCLTRRWCLVSTTTKGTTTAYGQTCWRCRGRRGRWANSETRRSGSECEVVVD